MTRPATVVACLGTATEVGKTWVGASVMGELRRRGVVVAARKPAQSFDPEAGEPTDAQVLAAATGERTSVVVPDHRSYPIALAPPMAAARLGRATPLLAGLLAEVQWPVGCQLGWLETVGGVRSPIAADADSLAFAASAKPDCVVLVGDSSLGAIGAVVSALDSLSGGSQRINTGQRHGEPTGPSLAELTLVFLNRFDAGDPTHVENHDWLSARLRQPIFTDVTQLAGSLLG